MPQYTLADAFLQRIYQADEQKIMSHHQALLILRVMASCVGHTIDYDSLHAFIEEHPALKGMMLSSQSVHSVLKWHLRRLIRIGVIIEK